MLLVLGAAGAGVGGAGAGDRRLAAARSPSRPIREPLPAGPLAVEFGGVRFGYCRRRPGAARVRPAGAGRRRRWRWSARPARASRPCRCCCRASTTRRAARFGSAASTCGDLAMADLRGAVGVVFEEAFLFSDTIAANIALRPTGRHRRRDPGRRDRRRGGRVHRGAARRLRHGDRRTRAHPVRRPAAAAGAGQGDDHRSAGAGAGRRDQRRRPDHRGGDPRHPAPGHRGPDDDPDRPPALDPGAGRPHRGGRSTAGWSTSGTHDELVGRCAPTGTCSAPTLRRTPSRTRSTPRWLAPTGAADDR